MKRDREGGGKRGRGDKWRVSKSKPWGKLTFRGWEEEKELAKKSEVKCPQGQEKIKRPWCHRQEDVSIGNECSTMSYTTENLCKMQTENYLVNLVTWGSSVVLTSALSYELMGWKLDTSCLKKEQEINTIFFKVWLWRGAEKTVFC